MGVVSHARFESGPPVNETLRHALAIFSISDARKLEGVEDGSPGINDPDGAIQENGTRERRRKQDCFLENRTEEHSTHT